MRPLLAQCQRISHQGHYWYLATQLRRLASKSYNHGKIKKMAAAGKTVKLPVGNEQKWFVRQDAVGEVLCIKQAQVKSVAITELLNTGGTA